MNLFDWHRFEWITPFRDWMDYNMRILTVVDVRSPTSGIIVENNGNPSMISIFGLIKFPHVGRIVGETRLPRSASDTSRVRCCWHPPHHLY